MDDEHDAVKNRAIAVAELRAQMEANTQRATLTSAQRKLLDLSAKIFDEPATRQDAAYLPRELVQVTLPHKNPGDVQQWKRTNGNLTIGIQPGQDFITGKSYGYPYGTIPRRAIVSSFSSARAGAVNCSPTGMPARSRPTGIVIAQRPK